MLINKVQRSSQALQNRKLTAVLLLCGQPGLLGPARHKGIIVGGKERKSAGTVRSKTRLQA